MSFAPSIPSSSPIATPMLTASGSSMGKSGQDCGKVGQVDGRTLAERVGSFLREVHPLKTAQCVQAETGVPANTVRKWLEQGNAPSGPAYDALVRRYGPAFLCRVHPEHGGEWFAEVLRQEQRARLQAQAATILDQLAYVAGRR